MELCNYQSNDDFSKVSMKIGSYIAVKKLEDIFKNNTKLNQQAKNKRKLSRRFLILVKTGSSRNFYSILVTM